MEYTRQRSTASAANPLRALVVSSSDCTRATTSAETCTALSTMAMTRRTLSVVFTVGLEGRRRCRTEIPVPGTTSRCDVVPGMTGSVIRVGQVRHRGGERADLGLISSCRCRSVDAHASHDEDRSLV